MITYESCFTGKVNTYSCERTMKEYVHGLFIAKVEINSLSLSSLFPFFKINSSLKLMDIIDIAIARGGGEGKVTLLFST